MKIIRNNVLRCYCLCCWYWWNYWQSLLKHFFHDISDINIKCHVQLICIDTNIKFILQNVVQKDNLSNAAVEICVWNRMNIGSIIKCYCSPPVFTRVHVNWSLFLCLCFVDRCLSLCTFFAIMLSVLLRHTDSDYPFVIFKLFLQILGYILVSLVDLTSN